MDPCWKSANRSMPLTLFNRERSTMKRLLVVDDALFMRKMICGVAAEAGWQVVGEARTAQRLFRYTSNIGPTWSQWTWSCP